jgi:haloacid dehalogenase superfamily, subfamily IA, variant 3 with third motif having DD or ED/haloacid dehalogenase superfamily, subfamily IA, variant 1 with third motif having Dx(3-4)D or Dx(3-4)E
VLRGLIFDLDNTLVDSGLDFDAMRCEMGLPQGLAILEAIARLPPDQAQRSREILHRRELEGAQRATLLPGVAQLLAELRRRGLHQAIATRNSRSVTEATLHRLGIEIELVLTRDCGPIKPDPWPVLHACQRWGLAPAEVAVIGDYRFDIECGRAAGAKTVLLTHAASPHEHPNHEGADLVLSSLADYPQLLAWIASAAARAIPSSSRT